MQQLSKIEKFLLLGFFLLLSGHVCMYGLNVRENMYYFGMAILGIVTIVAVGGKITPNPKMFLIYACMWLSILVNWGDINPVFKAPQRNVAFFMVLLLLGPFFEGKRLNYFKISFFNILNIFFVLISVVSFIGKFSFLSGRYLQHFYIGCTHHSMMLGCIAGYSALFCLDSLMYVKNKKIFMFLLFAMLASILMTLYASSRTVVIALLAAIPFYLLKSLKEQLGNKMRFFIMLIIAMSVLYPFFEEATLGIRSKIEMSSEHNDFFYTRVNAWNRRMDEFLSSPIFGVGTHTTGFHKQDENDGFFQKRGPNLDGQIEPGNAWLYFLSSMGIVGFMAVMFLLFPISKRLLLAQQSQSDGLLVGSLLVYSYVYMMAEAHVTACGDYNCVYFWLLISIAGIKDITLPERRIGINPVISNVFPKVA